MWPDRRLLDLFGIEHPIVLAPMAGAMDAALAIEVCEAGALGSLPCAMFDEAKVRSEVARIRARTERPINLNFFCHRPPSDTRVEAWRAKLQRYYDELRVKHAPPQNRAPFDDSLCAVVEELKPAVVSFHFGLPSAALVDRVRAAGCRIISSATTVDEAVWLQERGVDAIIAQGYEAGGHRGMFLGNLSTQVGTFALVPQVVDAVRVPVIAAGGVADARGIAAALILGAAGVQIGSAYLRCPESTISEAHRAALRTPQPTVVTNVITGRPARGFVNRIIRELGPISDEAPEFPLAAGPLAPLRAHADFAPMWAGQAASLGREVPARELTAQLVDETLRRMRG
jgi:nitronate monooxygenase